MITAKQIKQAQKQLASKLTEYNALEERIQQVTNDLATFFTNVQNKEYALAYVRELNIYISPMTPFMRAVRSFANTLENTNNPEPATVDKIINLRKLRIVLPFNIQYYQLLTNIFEYVDLYVLQLQRFQYDDNIIPVLKHNISLVLLSFLENNTYSEINKTLAESYYYAILPIAINAFPLPFPLRNLLLKINQLSTNSNVRPSYLVQAIETEREAAQDPSRQNRYLATLVQPAIALVTRRVSVIRDNELVQTLENDLRWFLDAIFNRTPINLSLARQYLDEITIHATRALDEYITSYLNSHPEYDTIPPTQEFRNRVIRIQEVNDQIRATNERPFSILRGTALKTPFKSIPSIPKTPLRSSPTSEQSSIPLLDNFQPPFKTLETKLKRIYKKYTATCQPLTDTKKALQDKITQYQTKTYTLERIDPDNTITALYKYWKQIPTTKDKLYFSLAPITSFAITYSKGEGMGQGVARDFFQKFVYQLTREKLFIPLATDEATQRYTLNPEFPIQDSEFYEFIGKMLCFILINDIGLNFHLSHALLAHLIYKHDEIPDDEYIGYFMLDAPEYFNGFANLMRDPDTIESVGLNFNDVYPLHPEDPPITKDTLKEYMTLFSKHTLQTNQTKALLTGFSPLRKLLRQQKITIPTLDKLITFDTIDDEAIAKVITTLQRSMEERMNSPDPTTKQQSTALFTTMASILKDKQIPNYYDFIERLLQFWTGYRHYSDALKYNVTFKANAKSNTLPTSQTCYATIYIPVQYHNNKEILLSKLQQSVSYPDSYFQMAGATPIKTHFALLPVSSTTPKPIYQHHTSFYIHHNKRYLPLKSYIKTTKVKYTPTQPTTPSPTYHLLYKLS